MDKKPKQFAKSAILQIIIAAICLVGGTFIIVFNIIIYPKFNSLIYSVIGLFVLVIVLLLIAATILIKYNKAIKEDVFDEDSKIAEEKKTNTTNNYQK